MENKILVLGATGMVGRVVFAYLSRKHQAFGTSRESKSSYFKYVFPDDNKNLEKYIKQNDITLVINCIGGLKNNKNYNINYQLPSFLVKISKRYIFKIINISSDDVFASSSGRVNEGSRPSPDNSYGKSKLEGEIESPFVTNIRTSFIGFDPRDKKGLIEWLKREKGKTVEGFTNQIWSGCTTFQLALLCEDLINKSSKPLLHFPPLGPITKFQLLKDISSALRLGVNVEKSESDEVRRILTSIYFDKKMLRKYTTDTKKAILELSSFENQYEF